MFGETLNVVCEAHRVMSLQERTRAESLIQILAGYRPSDTGSVFGPIDDVQFYMVYNIVMSYTGRWTEMTEDGQLFAETLFACAKRA